MGLAKSTWEWYLNNVYELFKAHKQLTVREVQSLLQRMEQRRYPIDRARIVAVLRLLRALGKLRYNRTKRIWELC